MHIKLILSSLSHIKLLFILASIVQIQFSTLFNSKPVHTVVAGLDEPRSSYSIQGGDDFLLTSLLINVENYCSETKRSNHL